jgi:hypothetical protein
MIGQTGLQFYGKTVASLSHEMKNTLAIIRASNLMVFGKER